MAVVRAKTSASYGVIIFLVFLLVIAIGLAAMFYTWNEDSKKAAETARNDLKKLGTPSDATAFLSPGRFGYPAGSAANTPNRTPLQEAIDEVTTLRRRIAGGKPGEEIPTYTLTDPDGLIDSKLSSLKYDTTQSLLSVIDDLAKARDDALARASVSQTNLDAARTTAASDRTNYEADRAAWQKTVQQFQADKDQLTTQVQQSDKDHKDDIAKFESQIDDLKKEADAAERANAVKLKQKDDDIDRIKEELERYKIQLSIFKPKNPVDQSNEPDGRIIRVETGPNSDVVYINLGKDDHASLGLTFAVYDPKYRVGLDAVDHKKATIEIVELGEHESTARVTSLESGEKVNVNDVIANPVFHSDRARKFHFYVYGDFDLEGDGVPTPAQREQLVRMIQNWGGVIDDQFSTQTDYLVLGALPSNSTHVFTTGSDDDKARDAARMADQKTYNDLIGKAHDWSIPVLNANRFLAMIGYYNTTLVHQPLWREQKVTSNRIDQAFAARRQGHKLLCPFLTAGYPDAARTVGLLLAAQRGGAGCIELGIPFSDPIADGPVIQASFTHALAKGIHVDAALDCVAEARRSGLTVPVLAMVSFSIIFKRGTVAFAQRCAASGLDGIILPDVPVEEAPAVAAAIRDHGLRTALLVAPTTPKPRRAAIAKLCDAFVYYLSVSGITGERKELPADIAPNVADLRTETSAPICVGFGISTPAQVRQVVAVADGAIVGSALIRRIGEHLTADAATLNESVELFVRELATGLLQTIQ